MAYATTPNPPVFAGLTFEQLRTSVIFLMGAISFFVLIEPAPVDIVFFVALLFFIRSGLSMSLAAAPLVLFLVLYNLGGFISLIPVISAEKAVMFVLISVYMGLSAIFMAYYVAYDPVYRFQVLRRALIVGGVIGAILGLIDYSQIGGFFSFTELKGRATGTFKDPNVFSTYLILPGLFLIQGLMLGTTRNRILSIIGALIISVGIFLSFSRGAWINFLGSFLLMVIFTFIVSGSIQTRTRIIIFAILMGLLGFVALSLLLTIESVRDMFAQRFSLVQSYDAGETGRFGNQLNALPVLMERPLGFGPLQFGKYYGQAPHNTFINAFSAYGWLGGISYFALIVTTVIIGFKSIFTRTPWQNACIVVFCPLFTTILQGVQIDTDHWRHFYWMLGLTWGLFAASQQPILVKGGLATLSSLSRQH